MSDLFKIKRLEWHPCHCCHRHHSRAHCLDGHYQVWQDADRAAGKTKVSWYFKPDHDTHNSYDQITAEDIQSAKLAAEAHWWERMQKWLEPA